MQLFALYIDPGSGSYLVQAIIAGILGAFFYFKNLWAGIISFFTRNRKKDLPENENKND
jgi:hypothetical protein